MALWEKKKLLLAVDKKVCCYAKRKFDLTSYGVSFYCHCCTVKHSDNSLSYSLEGCIERKVREMFPFATINR